MANVKPVKVITTINANSEMPHIPTREECPDLTDTEFNEWRNKCLKELEEWKKIQVEASNPHPNGNTQ